MDRIKNAAIASDVTPATLFLFVYASAGKPEGETAAKIMHALAAGCNRAAAAALAAALPSN